MNISKQPTYYVLPTLGIIGFCIVIVAVLIFSNRSEQNQNDQWLNGWKQLNPFSIPRRALAAVAANGYLYAIGGVTESGQYATGVEFAKILPNGQLGQWRFTSHLNQGRFYLAATTVNGYIYAIGGGAGPLGDNNQPVTTVERARILANGELGPWTLSPSLNTPRRGLKTVANGSRIYAIGGYNGIFLKSTEYAKVRPDGTLSAWQLDPSESMLDRYIHSSVTYADHLYVLGGHVKNANNMSYGDVELAKISKSGSLGPWKIAKSNLLRPRFIASAFALNKKLYILGGHNGASRLNSVEFAPINQNGHIGQWQFTTPLNLPRSASAVAVHKNYIYVLGGMGNRNILSSVEWAQQKPDGHIAVRAKK